MTPFAEFVGSPGAFWRFREPEIYGTSPDGNRRFGDAVDESYRFADRLLGRFLERMTDDSSLIIVSEHGFGTEGGAEGSANEGKFAPVAKGPAVLLLYGHALRDGVRLETSHLVDVVPTILALLHKDVAEDMDGRVLRDAIEPSFLAANPLRTAESYDIDWPTPDRYMEPR